MIAIYYSRSGGQIWLLVTSFDFDGHNYDLMKSTIPVLFTPS